MKEITTEELQRRLAAGEQLPMIDVRENDEVAEGMIPGAVHIPLGELPERLSELDKDTSYIMICRSGGRSGRASEFMESAGYEAVNMTGGMLNWEGETE